jgi:hypothetical protein
MVLRNAFEDLATEATLAGVETALTTGELVEAIEALRMAVQSLTRSQGLMTVDTAGRVRILLDAISASLTLGTITTVTGVTTVTTVTGQTNMGGFAAADQVPSLMHLSADSLRRNIVVI